ncbi:hypothetical protein ACFQL4_13635 [Halosimplex aquaticum]
MGSGHPVVVVFAFGGLVPVDSFEQPQDIADAALLVVEVAEFPDVAAVVVFEDPDDVGRLRAEDLERGRPEVDLVAREPEVFEHEPRRLAPLVQQVPNECAAAAGTVVPAAADDEVPPVAVLDVVEPVAVEVVFQSLVLGWRQRERVRTRADELLSVDAV